MLLLFHVTRHRSEISSALHICESFFRFFRKKILLKMLRSLESKLEMFCHPCQLQLLEKSVERDCSMPFLSKILTVSFCRVDADCRSWFIAVK